jgi:hypothetical protein
VSRAPTARDYATLGLRPGASADDVRAAYRSLAKVHHPDRNPGDSEALERFRRITESYAVLQDRAARRPEPTPLSAARAARRRASQPAAAEVVALAQLAPGAGAWVEPDAVMVGPDRTTTLRPDATGWHFPTAQHVIRVERHPDGHHVYLPPQPSARWPLNAAAETDGLLVSALWIGDRQDGEPGSAAASRLPLRLLYGTVGDMEVGARGWAPREALAVDESGAWALDPAQPVGNAPHHATPLRVLREADGFRVHAEASAKEWLPAETPAQWLPVLTVILAGRQYPESEAASPNPAEVGGR